MHNGPVTHLTDTCGGSPPGQSPEWALLPGLGGQTAAQDMQVYAQPMPVEGSQ